MYLVPHFIVLLFKGEMVFFLFYQNSFTFTFVYHPEKEYLMITLLVSSHKITMLHFCTFLLRIFTYLFSLMCIATCEAGMEDYSILQRQNLMPREAKWFVHSWKGLIYSRNHHKTFEGSVDLYCFPLKRAMHCSTAENAKPILVIILMEKKPKSDMHL